MTCDPGGSDWITVIPAAMPLANASADSPLSSAAKAFSSCVWVGFDSRMYVSAPMGSDAGFRSNVVERWIGGATAPEGSVRSPACTTLVSNLMPTNVADGGSADYRCPQWNFRG